MDKNQNKEGHMKKKTNIKTLIRTIVREEVAMAIGEVVNELKQPSLSSKSTQQVSQPKSKKKIVEKKTFSKNSIINDILNETLVDEEYPTMGGGTYDSSKINNVLTSAYGDASSTEPNGNLAASLGVNPEQPGLDFLKKDYRGLMKAMDKKKG
jgi:hypothetical protein